MDAPDLHCPWCRHVLAARPMSDCCTRCGGELPAPFDQGPGDAPPPAPRTLPWRFRRRGLFHQQPFAVIGAGMLALGVLFSLGGLSMVVLHQPVALLVFEGMGLIFMLMGALFFFVGRADGAKALRVLERGHIAEGTIKSVHRNRMRHADAPLAWDITYVFTVGTFEREETATSENPADAARRKGQRIWVVHGPDDYFASSPWPPMR
jgi:hypothetical protein